MSTPEEFASRDVSVGETVRAQYTRAPFPPVSFFPVLDGPPKDLAWSYSFTEVYYHTYRIYRKPAGARLLDAGCGTGHGIVQIRHQAPEAEVHACDFSRASLEIARKRIDAMGGERVEFHEMDILDLSALPGPFDVIFCSGVVHHTADPVRALTQLKRNLKPDGIIDLMLYSQLGRRETILMQRVIKLLTNGSSDQFEGLRLGRMIFDGLPPQNPIARWEREKWANNHRKHAEAFIDMYVNANEKNYMIGEVFHDLEAAGLRFVRFANPETWDLATRMKTQPELLERFCALPPLAQYEVIESLFPNQDQYYFFAAHAENEVAPPEWLRAGSLTGFEQKLTAIRSPHARSRGAIPNQPGMTLWAGYYGRLTRLDAFTIDLLAGCDGKRALGEICETWETKHGTPMKGRGLGFIQQLEDYGLLYLADVGAV